MRQTFEPAAARPVLSPRMDTPAQTQTAEMPSELKNPSVPSRAQGKEPVRKATTNCREKARSSRVNYNENAVYAEVSGLVHACFMYA